MILSLEQSTTAVRFAAVNKIASNLELKRVTNYKSPRNIDCDLNEKKNYVFLKGLSVFSRTRLFYPTLCNVGRTK